MDQDLIDRLLAELAELRRRIQNRQSNNPARPQEDLSEEMRGVDQAALLAGLLALSPDMISVLDTTGMLLFVSRSMPNTSRSAILGRNSRDFLSDAHKPAWDAAIERVVRTGRAERIEILSVQDYWWDTRIAPLCDAEGRVAYLLSIGTDITPRKLAEAELRKTEQQLALALEASRMGQWRLDTADNRFTWDAAALRLMGRDDVEEFPYRAFIEAVHEEDREQVEHHISTACVTGNWPNLEFRFSVGNGAQRWFLAMGKVTRDSQGHASTIVGGMVDITATKRRDDSVRRAQKLEAIGQLAGGVAHDFNNLLVAITGSIELARHEGDEVTRDSLLADALTASRAAADLTKQLLAFGRRQPVHDVVLELNPLVRDTVKLLQRLLPESIEIEVIEGHRLPRFLGDRGQIEQVLINLCINARDAMPQGGRITLETEAVLINGRYRDTHPWVRPGRYLLVSVTDTGTGMTSDTLDRIFEPFFTTKEEGTGLGLASAYGIVKQHGGLLHAYSEPGRGSTFKVYLPIVERDAAEVGSKIEGPIVGGTETILLAEDEAPVRAVVSRILGQAGYRVLLATNGEDAITIFQSHRQEIALLLLDAIMPRLNGTQALLAIRELAPNVPAIVSSGYSDALTSIVQPGVAFLQKPYEPDTLLRMVRRTIDMSR